MASALLEEAEAVARRARNGIPVRLAVAPDGGAEAAAALERLVGDADVVVSLLPAGLHPAVARACVRRGRPLVTSSYACAGMRALDGPARAAGVLLLCEAGLDPGLDHMGAVRAVRALQARRRAARQQTLVLA